MNRRFEIIRTTLLSGETGGSPVSWIKNVLGPTCEVLAGFKIEKISRKEDFSLIRLKGYDSDLWVHDSVSLHNVKQVIAEQLYPWMWHYYEVPETTVEKGEVVFDCGFAEGLFGLLVKNRAGKVYGFEPLDDFREGLRRSFERDSNVEVVEEALGDKPGEAFFMKGGTGSFIANEKTEHRVKVNSIDAFCTERGTPINYLKADIEGFEQELLEGAAESILQFRPKIAITVYHPQNDFMKMQQYLRHIVPGYKFRTKGVTGVKNKPVMLHAWL